MPNTKHTCCSCSRKRLSRAAHATNSSASNWSGCSVFTGTAHFCIVCIVSLTRSMIVRRVIVLRLAELTSDCDLDDLDLDLDEDLLEVHVEVDRRRFFGLSFLSFLCFSFLLSLPLSLRTMTYLLSASEPAHFCTSFSCTTPPFGNLREGHCVTKYPIYSPNCNSLSETFVCTAASHERGTVLRGSTCQRRSLCSPGLAQIIC
mmetsp:Transcript_9508/g.17853  ORF Transcript_9508/g.17853 Transcript_9508/m.17853 type:complete len:203 (-) Transcript_9508:193-801(-)